MTVNPSGWRPSTPSNEQGETRTVTSNRALMLEEPLIFEIGSTEQTGVDFARTAAASQLALGGLERDRDNRASRSQRARDRAPLHTPVAAELCDRPWPVPARLVHDEAQSAA